MKRIGTTLVVVLFFVLPLSFSAMTASAHSARTIHFVQKNVPSQACSADGCDDFLPHNVTNCLDSGLYYQVFSTPVYDPKGIFLGYEDLYRSSSCDAYWGTFYYPRYQHAISSVHSETWRVNVDNNELKATDQAYSCPCGAGSFYDAPMLGYDGTGEDYDGHYGEVYICDNNGCTTTDTSKDYSH